MANVGPGLVEASTFLVALPAEQAAPDRAAVPDLYGFLIGAWDADVIDHLPGGSARRQSAEMHFARVLEGRAVQDLWIVPARRERPPQSPAGNRYGTTLRFWDPAIDAWRVTWTNPVTGIENRLVGRQVGDDIVQTGSDPAGRLIRWVFADIRPDSFHWHGDVSADGGRTWSCETEFFARRRRS